jgi:WD40 repeat protein
MDRVRIRNAIGGIRAHITTEVAAYYGASLSRTTVLRYSYPRVCITKFAIDEATAAMITASTGASNAVAHQMHSPRTQHPPYPSDACVSVSVVSNPVTALLITPRPANYILWATSATASAHGTVRVVPFSPEPERAAAPRPHRPEDPSLALVNYDNMGVSWSIPESDIWDMTASPSGRTVVAACSSGLRIFGDLDHGLDNLMRRTNDREYMAVSFKDENIVFGGTRAGTVRIVDLRSLSGGTSRLRHGSGVAAVRALSNDNYVVVRGLEKVRY